MQDIRLIGSRSVRELGIQYKHFVGEVFQKLKWPEFHQSVEKLLLNLVKQFYGNFSQQKKKNCDNLKCPILNTTKVLYCILKNLDKSLSFKDT